MTATLVLPVDEPATTGFGDVVRSEWTKLRTLRSSWLCAALVVASMLGIAWLEGYRWSQILTDGTRRAHPDFDPTVTVLNGLFLAQLVIGVVAVLAISAEYGTGMIHATFTAVPQRRTVLAAKAVVVAACAFVLGEVLSFAAFLLGQALLGSYGVSLSDPDVLRAVVGAGLFLTVVSLLGLGIGAAIRHTAGAVSTFFAVLFAPVLLSQLLPGDWRDHIINWLPVNAGTQIFTVVPEQGALTPWAGLAVFTVYAAVAMAVAWVLVTARDA